MKSVLVLFLALCATLNAIDFKQPFFDDLKLEGVSLVEAVDRINKIHSSQSEGHPEFLILLEDPLNMNEKVSLSLSNVTLDLLLNVLLSGTNYHYVTMNQYVVIHKNESATKIVDKSTDLDHRESVCLVEVHPSSNNELSTTSWGASGSGFLCEIKGVKFLVTNIHVIEAANALTDISVRTRDNVSVELSNAYIVQDRDICVFKLKENSKLKFLRVSDDVSKVRPKDAIYLLGYPLGGGVLRKSEGTLDGIGSKLLELDCSAFSGNSGGPVFDAVSGEVIGVLTKAEIVPNDRFTKLAREKLTNPIKDDIRAYATRLDTIEMSNWEPLVWHIWKDEKERIYDHMNSLLAIASLVDSNYQPGTLITDENLMTNDSGIWRAYRKCEKDFSAAVRKGDSVARSRSLEGFIDYIEVAFRPNGARWRELSQPWKYEWFVSGRSGNLSSSRAEDIKKLYRIYHHEWEKMSERWDTD